MKAPLDFGDDVEDQMLCDTCGSCRKNCYQRAGVAGRQARQRDALSAKRFAVALAIALGMKSARRVANAGRR